MTGRRTRLAVLYVESTAQNLGRECERSCSRLSSVLLPEMTGGSNEERNACL
jgi:hypothetical protein